MTSSKLIVSPPAIRETMTRAEAAPIDPASSRSTKEISAVSATSPSMRCCWLAA